MISWIITVIFVVIGMWLLIYSVKDKQNDPQGNYGFVGICILFLLIFFLSATAYRSKLYIPERYKYITTTIKETQALIDTNKLSLADMQMHKQLAELIKEKNQLLLDVNINNKSPLAYYKIVLD